MLEARARNLCVHFHEDDIELRWETDFSFTGAEAADRPLRRVFGRRELSALRRLSAGRTDSRCMLLIPTFTYTIYGTRRAATLATNGPAAQRLGCFSQPDCAPRVWPFDI